MFKHILVAYDFSPEADRALLRAEQLAGQYQARLTLLHVTDPAVGESGRGRALEDLKRLAANHASAGHLEFQVWAGRPAETALEVIADQGCDLLVTGRHHQVKLELFSGTNLERMARYAPIPLLTVCNMPTGPYRQAAVAVNNSICACQAFDTAYAFLDAEAKLHAVNIFETPPRLSRSKAEAELEMHQRLVDKLIRDQKARVHREHAPEVIQHVFPGTLAGSLDEWVHRQRPELLVLGQNSRSVLINALLGSLPAHYLRQPPCDVMVVK